MISAIKFILPLVALPYVAQAQQIDFNNLLRHGINETVKIITAPPAKPASPPPSNYPPIKKVPPAKSPGAQPKPATKAPTQTAKKAAEAPFVAATGKQAPQSAASVQVITMTKSPLLRPIVLPTYQGLPIISHAGSASHVTGAGEAYPSHGGFSRLFNLMDLATNPSELNQPARALQVAHSFVAPENWGRYFKCNYPSCIQPANQPRAPDVKPTGWLGENEFEQARSHKQFVEDFQPVFISEAQGLPFDIYLTSSAILGQYSAERGGMLLSLESSFKGDPQYGPSVSQFANRDSRVMRQVLLTYAHQAATHIHLPNVLKCEPQDCERYLSVLDSKSRQAFMLVKLRLVPTDPSSGLGPKVPRITAQLAGPIVLHTSQRFDTPFYTLVEPKQTPEPAIGAGVPIQFPDQPLSLNSDTLALFILKHHPNGKAQIDIAKAAKIRRGIDSYLYDYTTDKTWPDHWGPLYPPLGLTSYELSTATLPDSAAAAYLDWSIQRAKYPIATLRIRFDHENSRPANENFPLISHRTNASFNDSAEGAILVPYENTNSNDPIYRLRDELDRAGIVPADRLLIIKHNIGLKGAKLSDHIALSFPMPLASYTAAYNATQDSLKPTHSVIEATIKSVSMVPSKTHGEIMVVQLEPKQAWLYSKNGLLTEANSEQFASSAKAGTAQASGHDIVGLTLGMPMAEAEKTVRTHLAPDLVYDVQAKNAKTPYKSARLFMSTEKREVIAIFPTENNTVIGIERRLRLPLDIDLDVVRSSIQEKYGKPLSDNAQRSYWTQEGPARDCVTSGISQSTNELVEGTSPTRQSNFELYSWVEYEVYNALQVGLVGRHVEEKNLELKATCRPVLEVNIQRYQETNNLRFVLYDHGTAVRRYFEALQSQPEPEKPKVNLVL